MNIKIKKLFIFMLTIILSLNICTINVYADSEKYLILGEDLTETEKNTVLELLEVNNIEHYNVEYITNEEEYQYLGDYLTSDVIGTRALSSILLTQQKEGEGIKVETFNITYCTEEMYQNALITAGVKDVHVKIAGPFKLSGTAALVATIKSYEIMTGEKLSSDAVDAANNEIVVTQEIGSEIGAEMAAKLIAALKQEVAKLGDECTQQDIINILDRLCNELGISLTDEAKQEIVNLMNKISKIEIDEEALKEQAKDIYNGIKDYVQKLEEKGFFDKLWEVLKGLWESIKELFTIATSE